MRDQPEGAALAAERMDDPALPAAAAARALADLERVNRWLLGLGPLRRALLPRLAGGPRRQVIVDLGTGSGQVPAALVRAARRRDIELAVVGVDRKLGHLLVGRRRGHPQVRAVADAATLPFRDGTFDWAVSTLFFHHFGAVENRRIAAEMRRVARRGAVVVDLRRSPWAGLLLRLFLPLLGAGDIARHDGRVSVARAWTRAEVDAWLAGEPRLELARRFPFRFSLVLPPAGTPSG